MNKDFLTLQDINQDEMWQIFELAAKLKKERNTSDFKPLAGKSIGLIFLLFNVITTFVLVL